MNDSTGFIAGLVALVLFALVYVWFALAVGAVFRKAGEAAWQAWVPVLNTAVLLRIGGFSPWFVFVVFIPLFGQIAFVVILVIAYHRINRGFGLGAGMTVLAALVPVVWASIVGFGSARWLGESAAGPRRSAGLDEDQDAALAPRADAFAAFRPMFADPVAPAPADAPPAAPAASPADAPAAPATSSFWAPAPEAPRAAASTPPPAPVEPPPVTGVPVTGVPGRADEPGPLDVSWTPFAAPARERADDADSSVVERPVSFLAARRPVGADDADDGAVDPEDRAPSRGAGSADRDAPAPAEPIVASPPHPAADSAEEVASPPARPTPEPAPWAPAPLRAPAPATSDPEAFPELSEAVSAVPGGPDAGSPMSARSSVSALYAQNGADDDDLDAMDRTVVARRRRVPWKLIPPVGAPIDISSEVVILGRRPAADPARPGAQLIAISDETRTVSKTHARLELRGETWFVTDLDSTNGVLFATLMGTEIEAQPGQEFEAGDRFFLGDAEVRLRRSEA